MSKLNYNNIDVQRLLNVLSELFLKFKICSFISYQNLDGNLNEITQHITNEELKNDINEHYELLKKFREKHIIQEEEEKKKKLMRKKKKENMMKIVKERKKKN